MIVDAETRLWSSVALSTDAVSTNSYDVGVAGNDVSIGEPLCVILNVETAAKVSGTTETYQFDLIQSTVTALTSPDILASFFFTTTRATTLLAAGKILCLPFPPGSITKEHIGIQFDGANTPTITVSAYIAPISFVQMDKYYATRVVVL